MYILSANNLSKRCLRFPLISSPFDHTKYTSNMAARGAYFIMMETQGRIQPVGGMDFIPTSMPSIRRL